MQRINLLYVVTKLELGGAQKQLLALIRGLDKEKFRIFLFTAREGLLIEEALSVSELTLIRSRCLERAINPLKDFSVLLEIYKAIRDNDIKIVHTHSSKAGILGRLAARLCGIEVVLHTVHGWSFHDFQHRVTYLIFRWLEEQVARLTDRIIVVSEHDKEKGLLNRIGNSAKYTLIRYGIDYAQFTGKKSELKKELGIDEATLTVGMVACFKPQKSIQDFIRLAFLAKQKMPGLAFVLVGDGVLRRDLEGLIRRLGLARDVFLCGWRRDIPGVLSGIDAFVLTSLWEGLPVTVLEAMASGKPVIATDTLGVREVVEDGQTGYLIPPKDMSGACEKLIRLLGDGQMRERMGRRARDSLGLRFHIDSMVSDTQRLYLDLYSQKGARHVN